jgi:hypothetical protein
MDKQFSGLNRRVWAAVAVSAAFAVPLGVFGAPALARSASAASEYQYSGSSQYKVLICHKTHSKKHPFHTISVAAAAVQAHLRHGDTLAPPCPPVTAPAPAAPKHGHGNGNGDDNHGNSGNNDHGNSGGNGGGKGHH